MDRTLPFTVLADDITGAAEIAGRAFSHGLRASVSLGPAPSLREATDLQVHDTETRLSSPADAAREIDLVLGRLPHVRGRLFKKVDSALRGPLGVETGAVATHLGCARILLVPANPASGRRVSQGIYTIDGIPLPETAFGSDPHDPRRSARVVDLIGPVANFRVVSAPPGQAPAASTLTVGDAASVDDLARWARQVDADTLPVGSAAFFTAWMKEQPELCREPLADPTASATHVLGAFPVLLLSGTTVPAQHAALCTPGAPTEWVALAEIEREDLRSWFGRVVARLQGEQRAVAAVAGVVSPDANQPARIRKAFAALSQHGLIHGGVRHLVIEGGATAAEILQALGWNDLDVVAEWSPGVVTLRPSAQPACCVTMKPGSYAWPPSLASLLFGPGRAEESRLFAPTPSP